ncbi:MAG: tetratricopeptide repeat protein [Spirochaetes bacterium]|nr:tetratricopeptide repeat protein [Spirochaetota bacterium]
MKSKIMEFLKKYLDQAKKLYESYRKKWGLKFVIASIMVGIILLYLIIFILSPMTGRNISSFFKYHIYDALHNETSYLFDAGVKYEESGFHYFAIGSFKRALRFKGDMYSVNPQDLYQLESLYNLGVLYYKEEKDYPRSMHYFSKYLEIFPKNVENPHKDDIYNVINYILSLDDKTRNVEAKKMKNVANQYYFKGDYEKAIEHYLKAIALDPGYVEVYNNLGTAYLQMNDFKNAVKYWKITLMFDPNDIDLYINLALAYHEKIKDYSRALEYYEKFMEKAPQNDGRMALVRERIEALKKQVGGK